MNQTDIEEIIHTLLFFHLSSNSEGRFHQKILYEKAVRSGKSIYFDNVIDYS